MKSVVRILLVAVFVSATVSCWKETYPSEATSRPELLEFTAVAGDEEIYLSWSPYDGVSPEKYIIKYEYNQLSHTRETVETSYVITGVENGVDYTVSVQAVYKGNVISNKVSADVRPETTRFPVTVLNVESGNAYVVLEWKKPHETLLKYKLIYSTDGQSEVTVEIDKDIVSYRLDGLENVKLYSISLVGIYERGESSANTVMAMPCEFVPYHLNSSRVIIGKPVTFLFNSEHYPYATDVVWTFDGESKPGKEAEHVFWSKNIPEIKLSVRIDGNDVVWPVIIPEIEEYVFDFNDFSASDNIDNGFYASTPVFSPDEKTVYQITTSPTTLYAIDIESGIVKWTYKTSENSRFSASVNPVTGDICFGTAVAGGYYCITEDGNLKWKFTSDAGFNECGPAAVSKDGSVIYVGDIDGTIYSINASTGMLIWKNITGGGITGGVLVNGSEVLYGTNKGLFFIDTYDGSIIKRISQQMWKTTGFAVSPDRKYAYLSCKDGANTAQSIARIDLKKRIQDKVLHVGEDNTWGIAVNADGLVFAGNKDGCLYCVEPDLSAVRWTASHKNTDGDVVSSSFNFSHPVADADGNFLITSAGNDNKSLSTTYWFEGSTGRLKDSWTYSGDVLKDGKNYSQQAGNNLINGYFFSSYNSYNDGGHPGSLLCKYIGVHRAVQGWPSIGGDVFNSNCIN